MGHADFQIGVFGARLGDARLDDILAADKDRLAEPGILERGGGADHRFLFAFGENDALGIGAHARRDALEQSGGGIEPRRKLVAVGVGILQFAPRHAGVDRRFRDRARHAADKPRIERHRE